MFDKSKKMTILMALMFITAFGFVVSPASAACTNVGSLGGLCNITVDIINTGVNIIQIVTGSDALTAIFTFIVLVVFAGMLLDLGRGESSYLRRRFGKV